MASGAFHVKVQLDVHAVTCPGVWLCPNGKVALRINILDSYVESQRQSPIFPLLFHDKFTFDKIFARRSLVELQSALEEEFLYTELIQWITPASRGITLATFETNLSDLLYPASCFKGLLAGVDIDLLMEPTKCFPGIIAPKIEVSTKTIIEEILGSYDTSMSKCYVINPKMINPKQTANEQRKRPIKGIIRQRGVCHTKPRSQSCRPYRQRSNESHQCCSRPASHRAGSQTHDQCYHFMKKNSICTCRSDFPKLAESTVIIRDNTHVTDNCPVCFKYNCYFPKCHDDSDIVKRYGGVDTKQRYCRNVADIYRKGAFDTQEGVTMPLLQSKQSKIENLQETNEKWYATGVTDDVVECNPRYEYVRDYSPGRGFYKDLEKFYKRMYKQAKMRARETDV